MGVQNCSKGIDGSQIKTVRLTHIFMLVKKSV